MEIRKASVQDLGQIMQVYDKARKFMRENGNAEQWGEDYPSAELIEHDIDKMYLCMSEGRIACVFYYAAEEDEDYKDNPVVFPPKEAYAGQETYRYLGEREDKYYNDQWIQVKVW